jgi:hypothetical protein
MSGIDNVDPDYTEQVTKLLVDGGLLEGTAAYGIAQQAVKQGFKTLSEKQWEVFYNVIMPLIEEDENEQAMQHAMAKDDD